MQLIYILLFLMNCLTEFQLNKMMMSMHVFDKKKIFYHGICAFLRIGWVGSCTVFSVPLPLFMLGLFVLLYLNIIPYHQRSLLMNNFTIIIYLMYTSLLMFVIGCVGMIGFQFHLLVQDEMNRLVIFNMTFVLFNVICFILLRYRPEFLWKEDYDRQKVLIYTRFLFICALYHIIDSFVLVFYKLSSIDYILLVSGDILIFILVFFFLNYNYVFVKSELVKKEYEESEILMAQQYFEKEKLKLLSEHDSLTNAYNRREICSLMENAIQKGQPLICVFVDFDNLKSTNDHYGHMYGDLLLKRFANACITILEGKGSLARIGGDEFLLVFFNQEMEIVESSIKQLQDELLKTSDEKERVYFSYGISFQESSVENYITSADQKMYDCKRRKRCDKL